MRRLLLAAALWTIGCADSDPCASQAGECLAVHVVGQVGALDSLHFDVAGATSGAFDSALPAGEGLPAAVAVLLPDGVAGVINVDCVGRNAGQTVALGAGSTAIAAGGHAAITLTLTSVAGPTCADSAQDGDESDIDCGGSCGKCGLGKRCRAVADCASRLCQDGRCGMDSCADHALDGSETDVDCGGGCGKCADGKICLVAADCTSGVCTASKCAAPSCSDGVTNGNESSVDCGGSCMPCADGAGCKSGGDCASGACGPTMHCLASGGAPCMSASACASADCFAMKCALVPVLASIVPVLGPSTGGTLISLDGGGFVAGGALAVTVDGVAASMVTFVSASKITALTPARPGVHGPVTVALTNGDGQTPAKTVTFTYYPGTLAVAAPPYLDVGTGASPHAVAADFDNDQQLDVALLSADTNSSNGFTVVQLNRGGYFKVASRTVGLARNAIVGDWNGDGNIDLFGGAGVGETEILLGNGKGALAAGVPTPLNFPNPSLAAGDLDVDGHEDIVVVSQASQKLYYATGKGDGTFNAAEILSPMNGMGFHQVVVTKVNGDAYPDLVVSNTIDDELRAFFGSQALTYVAEAGFFGVAVTPLLALGDFDGNGVGDVVAASGSLVTPYLCNGGGQFAPQPSVMGLAAIGALTAGDFNGDGKGDIVAGGSGLFLMPSDGKGGFGAPLTSIPTDKIVELDHGDFDGDGKLDLLVTDSNGAIVLSGTGSGGFRYAPGFAAPDAVSGGALLADFDGDGKLDLAVPATSGVAVWLGDGKGNLTPLPIVPTHNGPIAVVSGDFNQDGKIDLVAANNKSGDVSLLINQAMGGFAPAVNLAGIPAPSALAVGDFDGDQRPDVVVASGTTANFYLLLDDGMGSLKLPAPIVTLAPGVGIAAADFDGDGHLDVAVAAIDHVEIHFGNGDGSFQMNPPSFMASTLDSLTAGDLDGDGHPDLAAGATQNGVCVLHNLGAGNFQVGFAIGGGLGAGASLGDFDGDGHLDLVQVAAHSVILLPGKGDATFGDPRGYFVGAGARSAAFGDLDGDGLADLVAPSGSTASLLFNRSK